MDTSLERIRAKITELEDKLTSLRIAERELLTLEKVPARKASPASRSSIEVKPESPEASSPETTSGPHKTIPAAIAAVLGEHGALSVPAIAEHITAAGREINNRAISFALQALKKRGLVKSADGEWTLAKKTRRAK